MIPKEAVEEFKKIYKKKFKVDLSNKEALRRATNLLNLYKAVYGSTIKGSDNLRNEKR